MGRVTKYLVSLIEKQIKNNGIVVWYDPEGVYKKVVDRISLPDTTVIKYEDSLFRLKEQIDPYLEFITEENKPRDDCDVPPRLLIYLPLDRKDTQHALIEAETAGIVMEPGAHPWQLNTRLRVVAEHVFKQIAPDRVKDIADKIEQGALSLEDVDRLSSELEGIKTPSVKTIFGNTSSVEVIIKFLSSDEYDKAVQLKNALPEIAELVKVDFGINVDPALTISEFKKKLSRLLFICELVAEVGKNHIPYLLSSIPIPEDVEKLKNIKNCLRVWRNRNDLKSGYIRWAETLEDELGITGLKFKADSLLNIHTFPFIENILMRYTEDLILNGKPDRAFEIAGKRCESFWSTERPEYHKEWLLIQSIARVIIISERVRKDIKKTSKTIDDFINKYTAGDNPWFMLDRDYRQMERRYSEFDLDITDKHDKLERAVAFARTIYTTTIELMCESFSSVLEKDFTLNINQNTIYSDYILPALEKGSKVAYVLVDALRYEMGKELAVRLEDEVNVEITPRIAQVPTLTWSGMSSLLPDSKNRLELRENNGKMSVYLNDVRIMDKNSRIKYFKEKVDKDIAVYTLNNLVKHSKKLKEELESVDMVIVTSQEIDRLGESAEGQDEVRGYIEGVLEKLLKGIRRLVSLGFEHVVVTSDHGYIFGETVDSGMRIEPPGGNTLELHSRVWIGKGGREDKSFLRVKAHQVGLRSEFELAFPKSLACFKTRGGSYTYLHGGISLQEIIVPVLILKARKARITSSGMGKVHLTMEKEFISTRVFTVSATYIATELYSREKLRVRASLKHGKREVGVLESAVYGFDGETREVSLEKDKLNHLIFRLNESEDVDTVTIYIYDAITEVELGRLEKIPVKISL